MKMKIDQETFNMAKNTVTCRTSSGAGKSHWFHWHEKYEICQVLNKPCNFLIDGTLINALPGDIVAFKERGVHCFLIEEDHSFVRVLQLPTKILLNAGIPIKTLKSHIALQDMKNIPGFFQNVNTLFGLIEQECASNPDWENPFLHSLATSLYFLLMRHFSEEEEKIIITKEQRDFYNIVEYINEHFLEDINISTLSEMLFLSRNKLSAIFTKYSGTSLNNYLNSLRIKNANELMMQGYTITQAALESGFQSIRTFNNVYKKITGITPSDYAGKK